VSVIGPLRMDYGQAIRSVREAALQLSSYIAGVYDEPWERNPRLNR
jgi:transcriptional regulator of heat shock response